MDTSGSLGNSIAHEAAFRAVLSHRTMLTAYVFAIVRDPDLTEDTLSDVAVEIARVWDRYDSGRPFGPWARAVARRIALTNLRKKKASPVQLDSDVLESLAVDVESLGDQAQWEARKRALGECIQGLPDKSRHLIALRYSQNLAYRDISLALSRSVDSLYVAVDRIHDALLKCVERRLEPRA
jgi:RNA polymerase sigma-70 factor, ECF subfamily